MKMKKIMKKMMEVKGPGKKVNICSICRCLHLTSTTPLAPGWELWDLPRRLWLKRQTREMTFTQWRFPWKLGQNQRHRVVPTMNGVQYWVSWVGILGLTRKYAFSLHCWLLFQSFIGCVIQTVFTGINRLSRDINKSWIICERLFCYHSIYSQLDVKYVWG